MANAVEWIKLTTDMFDNRKIKHLRRLPEGNNIVLIWVMLLTMAGRCNSGGMIFLTENIPYTPKMLADELEFEENTVRLALDALEQLNMIVTSSGYFKIAGWEEHQNVAGLDKIREQNRLRQSAYRSKQKLLSDNVTSNVTVTLHNATEEDKEIEKEKDIDIDRDKVDCPQIIDLYHSICKSFSSVRSLSADRKKAIRARLKTYTLEDFKTVFENAEASSFLKGANDRNWTATFDWLIKDSNMAKVLDGNYADKPKTGRGRKEIVPAWCDRPSPTQEEFERLKRLHQSVTVGDDPELAERAERLKQKLNGGM